MDDVYIIIEDMNGCGESETKEVCGIFKTKQDALKSLKQIHNEICDEAEKINKEYPDEPPSANVELIEDGEGILYSIWSFDTKYYIRRVRFGEHFDIWQL